MLTTELLKELKQVNVSKDVEKTRQRIKDDFSSAPRAVKKEIETLSGQKRHSFYRAYETGSANARIVLAMAQTLNVSPDYYTGQIDEKLPLEENTISHFLSACGYTELAEELRAEQAPKQNRARKSKKAEAAFVRAAAEDAAAAACAPPTAHDAVKETDEDEPMDFSIECNEKIHAKMQSMTEDEAILLLRALFLRADANDEAARAAELVKLCLLR